MTTDLVTLKAIAAELAPLSASPSSSALTPPGLNVGAASEIVNELIWCKENPPAPQIITVTEYVAAPPVVPPRVSTMPRGDLPGWKQFWAEDFDRPADYGQVEKVYGTGIRGYSGFRDTYKKGLYDPAKVLSVPADSSYLDIWLRTVDGIPRIACPIPMNYEPFTYGRFDVRWRSDQIEGYKVAWMLWPSSNLWAEGEIDFPEMDLVGTINGYDHNATGSPSLNAMWAKTGVNALDWHTTTIEWTPNYVAFLLDGAIVGMGTKAIGGVPTKPMRWTLQCETKLDSTAVPANASGHIQIDWMTAYKYVAR